MMVPIWRTAAMVAGHRSSMAGVASTRLALMKQHLSTNSLNSTSTVSDNVSDYEVKEIGSKYSVDFKSYATKDGKILSYFHDIPLDLNAETKEVNMVVEIPRWTNAKFEIDTTLPGNPIVQDTKKGQVRFVKNLFPYRGYIHNYGALPQTWEDPSYKDEEVDYFGDNDPVDVCEIGHRIFATGDVVRVKLLGAIALIDDGELDWKIIAINTQDPLAQELSDIHDVYTKCPGLLESTRQWFRDYKKPDGKPENKFAFNGKYKTQAEAVAIVKKCQNHWLNLLQGKINHSHLPITTNTTLKHTPGYIKSFNTSDLITYPKRPDSKIPDIIDETFYVSK
jgi:inorganic pyrophosphatase